MRLHELIPDLIADDIPCLQGRPFRGSAELLIKAEGRLIATSGNFVQRLWPVLTLGRSYGARSFDHLPSFTSAAAGTEPLAGPSGFAPTNRVTGRSAFAPSALRRDLIVSGSHRAAARLNCFAGAGGWLGVRDDFRNWLIHAA